SEQKLIQKSAKNIFKKYYSIENIREFTDNPSFNKKFINSIADNGILGVIANNKLGLNLGVTDSLPVFIESGYNLIPFPLIENVIGARVLSDFNHELASSIIQGKTLTTIGWSGLGRITPNGDSWRISGEFKKVPFGEQCEWLLVP